MKCWTLLFSQHSMTLISEKLVYIDLNVLTLNVIAKTRGTVAQWSDLRFSGVSNPVGCLLEIWDGENLWRWSRLEVRCKWLSQVNHSAKAIHIQHRHRLRQEGWKSTSIITSKLWDGSNEKQVFMIFIAIFPIYLKF